MNVEGTVLAGPALAVWGQDLGGEAGLEGETGDKVQVKRGVREDHVFSWGTFR